MKNKYAALSNSAKDEIKNANYVGKTYESCTVIEQAMWRYDLAVSRQGLENFIGRASLTRTPLTPYINNFNYYPVVIISVTILVAFVTLTIIKKRKEINR